MHEMKQTLEQRVTESLAKKNKKVSDLGQQALTALLKRQQEELEALVTLVKRNDRMKTGALLDLQKMEWVTPAS